MDKKRAEELKEILVLKIESTSDWRAEKAGEYPNDATHNLEAAKALSELAEYVKSLPDDHFLFMKLVRFVETHHSIERETEAESELIKSYGYQVPPSPEDFIKDIINIYSEE